MPAPARGGYGEEERDAAKSWRACGNPTGGPVAAMADERPRHRSHWLREALAAEGPESAAATPPLRGTARADVAIVGGGFTGLWTSIHLKALEPALDIALLEADICGGGASGRNGGFVMTWMS